MTGILTLEVLARVEGLVKDWELCLEPGEMKVSELRVEVDSDWASDRVDRKSTTCVHVWRLPGDELQQDSRHDCDVECKG